MNDRPTPETNKMVHDWNREALHPLLRLTRALSRCEDLERQLVEALEQVAALVVDRDRLASRFTRLDKPKYTGDPMLNAVLEKPNAEFTEWVKSLPDTYWARYDLSAARVGWEAGHTRAVAEGGKK